MVEPGLTAQVTVHLHDVPWDQALDTVVRQAGLTLSVDGGQIIVRRPQSVTPALPEPEVGVGENGEGS